MVEREIDPPVQDIVTGLHLSPFQEQSLGSNEDNVRQTYMVSNTYYVSIFNIVASSHGRFIWQWSNEEHGL